MAIINPEIIAMARVNVGVEPEPYQAFPSYEFSNGFDVVQVDGAPGQPVIYVPSPGVFVMFLSNPEDAGELGTQGGLKARVDLVRVSTPSSPTPLTNDARREARWYYGDYDLPPQYAGVNPKKALVVQVFRNRSAYSGAAIFDVVVMRDVVTKFVGKKST